MCSRVYPKKGISNSSGSKYLEETNADSLQLITNVLSKIVSVLYVEGAYDGEKDSDELLAFHINKNATFNPNN